MYRPLSVIFVIIKGRAGADGARGMPGESGSKVKTHYTTFHDHRIKVLLVLFLTQFKFVCCGI